MERYISEIALSIFIEKHNFEKMRSSYNNRMIFFFHTQIKKVINRTSLKHVIIYIIKEIVMPVNYFMLNGMGVFL